MQTKQQQNPVLPVQQQIANLMLNNPGLTSLVLKAIDNSFTQLTDEIEQITKNFNLNDDDQNLLYDAIHETIEDAFSYLPIEDKSFILKVSGLQSSLANQFNQLTGLDLYKCLFHGYNDDLYTIPALVNQLINLYEDNIQQPYYLSVAKQIDNSNTELYLEPATNYSPEDLSDQTPMPLNLGLSFPISIIFI